MGRATFPDPFSGLGEQKKAKRKKQRERGNEHRFTARAFCLPAKRDLQMKRHHLDRRAVRIVGDGTGPDDDLLDTRAVSDWLGVSIQWLEIGRSRNYGPPFKRLGTRSIRYLRGDVRKWLKSRTYTQTAEYPAPAA